MDQNTAYTPGTTRFLLERREMVELRHAMGARLQIAQGEVWITQEGDEEDYLLSPGDNFEISRSGMALVQAMQPTVLILRTPTSLKVARKLPAGWPRMAFARHYMV